jgi:hypothetical protein
MHDAQGIGGVGLVALRRHRRADTLRLKTDSRKPTFDEFQMQPG